MLFIIPAPKVVMEYASALEWIPQRIFIFQEYSFLLPQVTKENYNN